MKVLEEDRYQTLGQIVSRDYRKAKALVGYGVDFSCDGSRTLAEALQGRSEDLRDVLRQWETIERQPPPKEMDYLAWDMAFLTNYIIQFHHKYIHSQTRFVRDLAFKVADSNQVRNPEIKDVAELFDDTGKKLEENTRREEQELFPYIIGLHEASVRGTNLEVASFGEVKNPLAIIKKEGEGIVVALKQIRNLTNNYVAPSYTSSTCPILYKLLARYEEDAHIHFHLEHNILFPQALKTEHALISAQQIIQLHKY